MGVGELVMFFDGFSSDPALIVAVDKSKKGLTFNKYNVITAKGSATVDEDELVSMETWEMWIESGEA